jgi:hypothetical protein
MLRLLGLYKAHGHRSHQHVMSFVRHHLHLCLLLLCACQIRMDPAWWGLWDADSSGGWVGDGEGVGFWPLAARHARVGPCRQWWRARRAVRVSPFQKIKIPDMYSILYYTVVYQIWLKYFQVSCSY